MRQLESYLPENNVIEEVKFLKMTGNYSSQGALKQSKYNHKVEMKKALLEALDDYLLCPADHGESFLAEILKEMLEMI